jgi:predicted nuclease with TOPRIM domain
MSDSKEIRDAKNLLFIKEHEVLFANQEIARLKAELTNLKSEADRFKAEVEDLKTNCDYLDQKLDDEICKSAMLCGHIMRLQKAGDVLLLALWLGVDDYSKTEKEKAEAAWQAAKDGKPTE